MYGIQEDRLASNKESKKRIEDKGDKKNRRSDYFTSEVIVHGYLFPGKGY